jgi:hypothetical protein
MTNPFHEFGITFVQDSDSDSDYKKVITVTYGKITLKEWAEKYLNPVEKAEWSEQLRIHMAAVQLAIDAGDCVNGRNDQSDTQIMWRNDAVHSKWMNTISQENHNVYRSYYSRYFAKMGELEQEKL